MARSYTTAARRAAATSAPTTDPADILQWVDRNTTRARQALRDLDARPVDPAAAHERRQLVDALLDVFPSFDIDGEKFHVMGEVQLLDLCEMMRLNKRNVKTVDPAGVAALADFFSGCLGPDEYDRFRTYCRDNCVEQDVLDEVMEGIVEDLSEVPTSRPSHSVPGPSTSGRTSKVVSLSQHPVRSDPPNTVRSDPPMSTDSFRDYLARQESPYGPAHSPATADPVTLAPQTPGFVSFG